MDPKTAKKELIIIVILFVAGIIFNFFAPEKFKLDFSDMEKIGFGKVFCVVGKILAPFLMGLLISGFYCAWKIIGLIWQLILQKSKYTWFVSPVWIFIGKLAKLIIAGQMAALIGLPIIIYSIYCIKKLKQPS